MEGVYWSKIEKIGRKVYLKNDTLRYSSSKNTEWSLIPTSDTTFRLIISENYMPEVHFNTLSKKMRIESVGSIPGVFHRIESLNTSFNASIDELNGTYDSRELGTSYTISKSANGIKITHPSNGNIPLKKQYDDIYSGRWPIGILEVKRDSQKKITGITLSNGRTRNVWLKKRNSF